MESLAPVWLLIINAIMIALVVTVPILIAIIIVRLIRRGIKQDRKDYEEEIRSQLGVIVESLDELKRYIEDTSKN